MDECFVGRAFFVLETFVFLVLVQNVHLQLGIHSCVDHFTSIKDLNTKATLDLSVCCCEKT